MGSFAKLLLSFAAPVVTKVKADIQPYSVSGESAKSVRAEVISPTEEVDRLVIYGPAYIETGRGPRESSKESGFEDRIYQWVQSVFPGESPVAQKKLAKYFRWKINQEGDKTFKEGGRKVYSDTLIKMTDEIKAAAVKEFRIKFSKFVKNAAHGIDNS